MTNIIEKKRIKKVDYSKPESDKSIIFTWSGNTTKAGIIFLILFALGVLVFAQRLVELKDGGDASVLLSAPIESIVTPEEIVEEPKVEIWEDSEVLDVGEGYKNITIHI